MSFGPREYLLHILVESQFLLDHSRGLSATTFSSDETLRRAFVRSLEVIGEAANKLPEEYRAQYPRIEWRAMIGMRNRLIHGYFGVDYDLVWEVVSTKIPDLHREVSRMLGSIA